jgi:signal transduction histidine kinase
MRALRAAVTVSTVMAANALLVRIRGISPRTVDAALAGLLVAGAVVVVAGSGHAAAVALIAAAVATAAVGVRHRAPLPSVAVTVGAVVVLALSDPSADETVPGIAALLVFYTLGRTGVARGRMALDAALVALGVLAVALGPHQPTVVDVVATWALFVAGPYVAGRAAENRSALTREMAANAERLQREQEARARSAAAEERTRIARELHDVIAHNVSVMVIQAVAARRVAANDRESARAALGSAQTSGREALLEMRRMIGVLRHGDMELAGAAAPGLGQLELLLQRARAAGLPVDLHVRGSRRPLPEGLDLVAFRVVQEALTNVIKHAGPAHASVTVTYADPLELEICDDGNGSAPVAQGGGHGLVGMRERLNLYGGELATGARPDGGFRVHVRLPVDEARAA